MYNPAALLNPKGQAKEKAKKRMPNYGPQQARKPTAAERADSTPSEPKFDSTALDPKAAAAVRSSPLTSKNDFQTPVREGSSGIGQSADNVEFSGMASLIERQHNVMKREAPPVKRRKVDTSEEEHTEDEKSKSTFAVAHSNGILGEHIREERQKAATESGPTSEPIDLTNDDDDDLLITGTKTLNDDNKEVCLGMLHSQANVHNIPRYPRTNQNILGKGFYPQIRVNYRRLMSTTNIIDLFDRSPNGDKAGNKFGKVEVKVASALCFFIDGNNHSGLHFKIFLDQAKKELGEYEGCRVSRHMRLRIVLYSPKKSALGIGKILSQRSLFLSDPAGVPIGRDIEVLNPHVPSTFGAKPQSSTKRLQNAQPAYGVVRTQEEVIRDTASMFDNLIKADAIPEMEADSSIIKTELQGLQKQALRFLTDHEKADVEEHGSQISLWRQRETKKGTVWANVITNHELAKRPEPVRGGILADVMGLGKTLSILSLHASTRDEAKTFGDAEAPKELEHIERNAKATLIVCPKSVMTNWTQQMKEHTNPRYFKTYSYHGSNRTQDLDELATYDIILAPYGTVATEFAFKNGPRNALASVNWFRVVLDEAHSIRTASTQVSRACCALTAQRRWAVTGTPVQNRLDDLGTLFKFLRIKPFDDDTSWGKHIMAPLKTADEHVLQHLQLLVASITLRRTKEKVGLPDRKELQIKLPFNAEERAVYSQFSGQANLQVRAMMREKGRIQGKGYAFMLRSIHRLRAICAHGQEMLSDDDLKELEGLTAQTAIDLGDEPQDDEPDTSFITEAQAYDFLHMMIESESDVCTGCGKSIARRKGAEGEDGGQADASEEESDRDDSDQEDLDSEAEAAKDVFGYINPCYDHLICPDCKVNYVKRAQDEKRVDGFHHCPFCDRYIRFGLYELKRSTLRSFLASKSPKNKRQRTKWDESSYSGPHTKVKALIDDLKHFGRQSEMLPRGEPPIKSVIFSGWTTYLDLIEYALDENSIIYTRLDGSMSIKQRAAVLDGFRRDEAITVILVSIKAGGQGLNLTSASKVFMMEPQFNPGVEQQAIDRVHRLGQTRDVEIKHFIMEDSIEEKIQKMQERKQELARLAMEKKLTKGEAAKRRIEDLRELFK